MGVVFKKSGAAPAYDVHLKSDAVSGTVLVEKKQGSGSGGNWVASTDNVKVHPGVIHSSEEKMDIEVQGGQTLNMGNYESCRIGVSLRMPCSKETLEETYKFVTAWVGEKITEAVKHAKGD